MFKFITNYKWIILLIAILFPFVLNCIIAQQEWPYWAVAGNSHSWISFWGAYAGAIGTVFMALIAMETLKNNSEQLELLKQQNCPHLFCSIFILHQRNHDMNCNEESYILRVENHGTQIAKHVKVKIEISDLALLSSTSFKKSFESIESADFSLPARGEKFFVIGKAIPNPPQEGSKRDRIEDVENQWIEIEQLKSCTMNITLSCDGYDDEHEIISLNSVGYLPTTTVQILDYINQSIKDLALQIDTLKK